MYGVQSTPYSALYLPQKKKKYRRHCNVYSILGSIVDEAINDANSPSPTQARRDPGQITDHTHTQTTFNYPLPVGYSVLRPDSLSPYRWHYPTIYEWLGPLKPGGKARSPRKQNPTPNNLSPCWRDQCAYSMYSMM